VRKSQGDLDDTLLFAHDLNMAKEPGSPCSSEAVRKGYGALDMMATSHTGHNCDETHLERSESRLVDGDYALLSIHCQGLYRGDM
jgi:hypothetical protein